MANSSTKGKKVTNAKKGKDAYDKTKSDKRNYRGGKGKHGNAYKRAPSGDGDSYARGGDCYADRTNDPNWYMNRGTTGLSGTYSWNNVVGEPYSQAESQVAVQGTPDQAFITGAKKFVSPGIAVYQVAPMFGSNVGTNVQATPINVAANKIYAFVRHANSGSRNYQKSDLVMYLAATAEAYSFYGWMGKIYGCLNKFSTYNRYWGETLLRAMNVDPFDLWKFQTNLKTYMNQYAARLNVLKIPANWPYFLRKYMMYSSVYLDEASEKAQLFTFQPKCFLKYVRDAADGHMKLESKLTGWTPLTATHWKLDDIINFGNDLINDIILDSDFALISGDILKAYGSVFSLPYIAEGFVLPFIYDEGINLQVENATIQPIPWAHSQMTVLDQAFDTNGNDALISNLVIDSAFTTRDYQIPMCLAERTSRRMLNCHKPTLDEGMLLEATRLTLMPTAVDYNDDIGGTTGRCLISSEYGYTGTEAIDQLIVYTGLKVSGGSVPNVSITSNYLPSTVNTSEHAVNERVAALQQFSVKPTVYMRLGGSNPSASTTGSYQAAPLQLVDNYIFLDVDDLRKLHTAALLSLFDVNTTTT